MKRSNDYENSMVILGLTGSIGTGKSTVSCYLQQKGIPILDADNMVKELYADKSFCKELSKYFGEEILNHEGYVDTVSFGKLVFENKEWLQKLNQLIHPKIKSEFEKRKTLLSNHHSMIVYDIPLLYEANMDDLVDMVALVYLEENKQIERIQHRDHRTIQQIQQIIASQMSQQEKKERADYILDNNGTKEELYVQIDNMILDILSRQKS